MENILIMKNMSIDKFFSVTLVTRMKIKGNVKSFIKKRGEDMKPQRAQS